MAWSALLQRYPMVHRRRGIPCAQFVAMAILFGVMLTAGDAVAGFQWVAPIDPAPTPVAPEVVPPADGSALPAPMQLPAPAAPSSAVAPENAVVPVVSAPEANKPSVVPAASQAVPTTPLPVLEKVTESAAPVSTKAEPASATPLPSPIAAPSAAASPAPATADDAVVEGFGKDMPLAIALKQILPSGYGFALEGVDPKTKVSWEGGKPWYQVLDVMLTKARLYGREEGQIIKISPAKLHDAVAPAAVEPPVIVPPVPETSAAVQEIEPVPPAAVQQAAGKPVTANATQAAVKPALPVPTGDTAGGKASDAALPPIPQGELVAPAANMMPPVQPSAAEVWHAEPGEHLHAVIQKWSRRANVELVWATEYDYPIQASINFSGSFEDAVRGLLTGFVEARPQPYGRLHDNPAVGQRTLVIEARGNTNSD